MLPIDLHPNAVKDIKELRIKDLASAGKLIALLQELKTDPNLQERMLNHGDIEEANEGRVEFQKWLKKWKQQKELWRVKVYEADKDVQALSYRIIYAHHPWTEGDPKSYFQILAVVHRNELNYDTDNDLSNRITRDYNELRGLF